MDAETAATMVALAGAIAGMVALAKAVLPEGLSPRQIAGLVAGVSAVFVVLGAAGGDLKGTPLALVMQWVSLAGMSSGLREITTTALPSLAKLPTRQ